MVLCLSTETKYTDSHPWGQPLSGSFPVSAPVFYGLAKRRPAVEQQGLETRVQAALPEPGHHSVVGKTFYNPAESVVQSGVHQCGHICLVRVWYFHIPITGTPPLPPGTLSECSAGEIHLQTIQGAIIDHWHRGVSGF